MASSADKRGRDDENQLPAQKRSTRSSTSDRRSSTTDRQSGTQTFPELEPFRIPDDINAIAPETLLDNSSTTVSEAIYVQDLNYIFTTAANQAIPNHIEMHKLWIRRRRPSVEDIWESRYPPSGSYQQSSPTSSLRMLLTIEKMLLLTSDEAMIRRLRILQLDYTMFMCLRHGSTGLWNMDRPNHYFPAHEEQFKSLIKTLENDPIPDKPSKSSVIIPAVKRAIFEALRVNADKVVKMDEISGYEDAKNDIKRAIFMATRTPQLTAHGIGSKGILLYGPPGTGKSLLAKSTAALSTKCAVFKASSADLIEKWMGESEQNVAHLFAIAAENAPSIIIIDEIESLCQNRQSTTASDGNARRVATTLLDRMTEHDNVCVLGTTNLPWQLDPAFARRFRRKVHVGLPSLSVRQEMIAQRLRPFNHNLSTADVKTFGQACSGFSGDSVVGSIEVVVEDLAYKIESATHFKRVKVDGQELYCPCGSNEGEVMRTYESMEQEGLASLVTTETLTLPMLQDAAKRFVAQVQKSQNDEKLTLKWAKEQFFSDSSAI